MIALLPSSIKCRLDKILGPECSTIVMDTNDDKADEYKSIPSSFQR